MQRIDRLRESRINAVQRSGVIVITSSHEREQRPKLFPVRQTKVIVHTRVRSSYSSEVNQKFMRHPGIEE